MAKIENINPLCTPGSLFVDKTCIDCWTCYHIAPEIFKADEFSKSYVSMQPADEADWKKAKEAILSCPVNSIGTTNTNLNQVESTLPRKIIDSIYYCGYTSKDSYGASSYFITHPEGNILVDSPRFTPKLVKEIESLGGIRYNILSHKDDIADHHKFHHHFKCERIIHRYEVETDTNDCEIILEEEKNITLYSDLVVLFSPGHSAGHLIILFKKKFLFTGDQLFYDHNKDKLFASKDLNWFSWQKQIESLKNLNQYDVEWIFPGHGGWCNKNSNQIKLEILSF